MRRIVWVGLLALIAVKLAFLFIFALNSRFVMDEFVQLGWAKYLGNGLFDTVWHPKAVEDNCNCPNWSNLQLLYLQEHSLAGSHHEERLRLNPKVKIPWDFHAHKQIYLHHQAVPKG